MTWDVKLTELPETGGRIPDPLTPLRTVLLDEKGRDLSSDQLAAHLEQWRDGGIRETRFVLGAADGHSDAERADADLLLAFGKATWPHLLARAMLLEQLYRATSILAGHPYHRAG
jgi:23S rRNA (pseudouridine1915-N3)-methyltransferase